MIDSLLLAGDSMEILVEPSLREARTSPSRPIERTAPGAVEEDPVDFAGALRRLTLRKALRRVSDAVSDLRATGSVRFMVGVLATNWHSGYDALRDIFGHVDVKPGDVLADVGCGKGRVVAFLSSTYPHNRVIGVEMESTALFAQQAFSGKPNVEIRHAMLEDAFPAEASIFFLYPPTDGLLPGILKRLIDRHATRDTLIVAKGAMGDLAEFAADPSWTVERIPPPSGFLQRLWSTHFIYGHDKRGPGYHYGLLLRKTVRPGRRAD
ncbi:MAG: methyltransferase domain-containing protein [Polyangiaceae bacterium]